MFQLIAIIGALASLAFAVHLCIKWYNMPKVEKEKTEQSAGKQDFVIKKREQKQDRREEKQAKKEPK